MAKAQRQPATRRKGGDGARWLLWLTAVVVLVAVLALPLLRWWWQRGAANPLRQGLASLRTEGCEACHRPAGEGFRWRAEGVPPSVDLIRDALFSGRAAAPGFPAAMPRYGERLARRGWEPVALAVAADTGIAGVAEDAETAAGLEILGEMGCYGCHGPLGAGGVPNPGSLRGEVGGFYGPRVARLASGGALAEVIRRGAAPRRLPPLGFPPPPLAMPGYEGRLDSTELELAQRAVSWLNQNPPQLP